MSVTILQGDCLMRMSELPESSVDAVIVDPPYCSGSVSESGRSASKGQGLRSENLKRFGWFVGDNMTTAGLVWLLRSCALEWKRLLKDSGSLLLFCDWRMIPNIAPTIESAGFRYQNLVTWDKESMGLGTGFRCQHEQVLHMTCGAPEYHDKATGNVIRCRRVSAAERVHQTQKPVELMERLARVVCPVGGTVLDCFCGSGSTGVACGNLGINFIGIDWNENHVDVARDRTAQRGLLCT